MPSILGKAILVPPPSILGEAILVPPPSVLGEAILVPPPPSLGRPLMAFPFHESHTGALHPWDGHTGAFPSLLGKAPNGLPLLLGKAPDGLPLRHGYLFVLICPLATTENFCHNN